MYFQFPQRVFQHLDKNTFCQDIKCFPRCDSILLFPSLDFHLGKMEKKKIHNLENGDKNKNVLIMQQMEYLFSFTQMVTNTF